MADLETSAFRQKGVPPDAAAVAAALGDAAAAWASLRTRIAATHGPVVESWAFSGAKLGWTLRVALGRRPLVYLTPLAGRFRASVALDEAAVARAPASLAGAIAAASVHPEGKAVRLEVGSEADLAPVLELMAARTPP